MKIERNFTKAGQDAYADLDFVTTVSEIRNPDGSVVFKLDNVEVPKSWSQVASDVIAQKYFRKAVNAFLEDHAIFLRSNRPRSGYHCF